MVVIEPTPGATWPTLPDRAGPRVRIDITCGYGDAAAVPTSLKLWIRAHVVAYLNDPAALITGTIVTINPRLSGLLDPHRVYAR